MAAGSSTVRIRSKELSVLLCGKKRLKDNELLELGLDPLKEYVYTWLHIYGIEYLTLEVNGKKKQRVLFSIYHPQRSPLRFS